MHAITSIKYNKTNAWWVSEDGVDGTNATNMVRASESNSEIDSFT